MEQQHEIAKQMCRRTFLTRTGIGLGSLALASLLNRDGQAESTKQPGSGYRGLDGFPQFAPKAKRVIFLCMAGGPSHLETFDYRPKLEELHGQPMPESFTKGQPIAQYRGRS